MSDEHIRPMDIFGFLREKKSLWLIAAALVIGVCLMIFGGGSDKDTSGTLFSDNGLTDTAALEERVKTLCENVDGVSSVSVMITIDTLGEQRYAYNTQKNYDGSTVGSERLEYVTTSQGVVPLGEVMPRVRGVAVVCRGGDDAGIKLKLTELLCALFSIPSGSVSIVGGK